MTFFARALFVAALLLAWSAVARADSWAPPTVRSYLSRNGSYRFTVHPRPFTNALDYFSDKVCGREPAGAPARGRQTSARAILERSNGRGGWTRLWSEPLVNEVAPVEAMVSNDGLYSVTLDNWHSMGFGDDVVAIYDARGRVVRSLGLADLLPEAYVEALPRSVSSIWWRRNPRFSNDGTKLIVGIVIPSSTHELEPELVDISIDLATGRPIPPSGPRWDAALEAVAALKLAAEKAQAEATAYMLAPLHAPSSGRERDWYEYLREASRRTISEWKGAGPSLTVLRAPSAPDYKLSIPWIDSALANYAFPDEDRFFASPSQENLAEVFAKATARLAPGSLKGVRIHVAVGDGLRDLFVQALAHTGARFIQIDPAVPIPPRAAPLPARAPSVPEEEKLCASPAG